MRRSSFVALVGLFLACDSTAPPSCPAVPEVLPAAGTSMLLSGNLVPEATGQQLLISPDRDYADLTFSREGHAYRVRYALTRNPPPAVLPYVFVRRPQPPPECAALTGRGPVVDAVELRRGGAVIASGGTAYLALARCPGQDLTAKASATLKGPPDGAGAPLADADYGWRWEGTAVARSGDDITVTVLDSSGDPFEVLVGPYQTGPTVSLGVVSGSATVHVP